MSVEAQEVAQSVPALDGLYFIRAESGPIKIGRGKDPQKRLSQCRVGSHEKLELIGVIPGQGCAEAVWHIAFKDCRLRGEWFEPDADLERSIDLALKGEQWWHHLEPPMDYELSDDEDGYDDDVVDWHIGIQMALVAAAQGQKPDKDPNALASFGQDAVIQYLDMAARRSWAEAGPETP